jgi:hypothetical protein
MMIACLAGEHADARGAGPGEAQRPAHRAQAHRRSSQQSALVMHAFILTSVYLEHPPYTHGVINRVLGSSHNGLECHPPRHRRVSSVRISLSRRSSFFSSSLAALAHTRPSVLYLLTTPQRKRETPRHALICVGRAS